MHPPTSERFNGGLSSPVLISRTLTLLVCLLSIPEDLSAGSITQKLWQENEDIYSEILEHPFLLQLQDGTLNRDVFAFYIVQDLFYLREFAKALKAIAAKAPNEEWKNTLIEHAEGTLSEEKKLHESIFEEYGITPEAEQGMTPAPEAFAYTTYLLATAHEGSFSEGVAILLPCYWIYWEVGKRLSKNGSKEPTFQKWIDTYASEDYGAVVLEMIKITETVAKAAGKEELRKMKEHYRRGCRYEWMFWDSAFHMRTWPPVE